MLSNAKKLVGNNIKWRDKTYQWHESTIIMPYIAWRDLSAFGVFLASGCTIKTVNICKRAEMVQFEKSTTLPIALQSDYCWWNHIFSVVIVILVLLVESKIIENRVTSISTRDSWIYLEHIRDSRLSVYQNIFQWLEFMKLTNLDGAIPQVHKIWLVYLWAPTRHHSFVWKIRVSYWMHQCIEQISYPTKVTTGQYHVCVLLESAGVLHRIGGIMNR